MFNSPADYKIKGAQIHQFNNVQQQRKPRSTFQKDFPIKTTLDVDYLVPLFVEECYPGDYKKISITDLLARLTTPIKPIMDNLYIETFCFFTPRRLLWKNFEHQQGEQQTGEQYVGLSSITTPVLDVSKAPLSTTGFTAHSLGDYFGITTYTSGLTKLDALYWRNYNRIYDDWFRDESVILTMLNPPIDDGPDDPAQYVLQKRRKRKDYLTGMLPWPQKGAAPTIPIGTRAPVLGIGMRNQTFANTNTSVFDSSLNNLTYQFTKDSQGGSNDAEFYINGTAASGGFPNIYADLSGAAGAVLNLLRQNSIYTQMLELDARSGTRYVESTYARFGVQPQDFRLQRPELVGFGQSMVNVFAVPQTSVSGATPQGNLAAFGVAKGGSHSFSYSCEEHGILMVIVNIRADLSYQQNVPRHFTRQTRLDFYEPLMNGMGEQPVYNRELYAQGNSTDDLVAGYQERFSDLRYRQAQVTGKFRSQTPTPLDFWHLSEKFGSLPTLNQTFIEPQTPMSRVVAVSTEPHFYLSAYVRFQDTRVMPIRSNPGIDVL